MKIPNADNHWVSEDFLRLNEIIHDYDDSLDLRYCPGKPYMIVDTVTNQPVMYASELSTPQEVLAKLWSIDNKNGDVLTRMEADNNALEAINMKKELDLAEERQEYVEWLIGTKKNYIKTRLPSGELVKMDDQLRRI